MPNKSYGILFKDIGDDCGQFYFPVKLSGLEYGGMPQFFGGTIDAGETNLTALIRETKEESNNQIVVLKLGKRIHSATNFGSTYNFYVVEEFTGSNFLGDLKGNTEMSSINKITVTTNGDSSIDDLMRLMRITPSYDFAGSETYTAFEKAIKWSEG
jgi:ADP-ribose pyrophosphatase YjhB (NUDIX family)